MSDGFSLLKALNDSEHQAIIEAKKPKYQEYDIELGFEKVKIRVPIDNAEAFEEELVEFDGLSTFELEKIVEKHEGTIQE